MTDGAQMNRDRLGFAAALRFAKRARTALLKRLKGNSGAGNFVFEYRGEHALPPVPMTEVQSDFAALFGTWDGGADIAGAVQEAVADGAHCYAALGEDGTAICYLLARTGKSLDNWFIELEPGDAVLYSIVTHVGARGQRLAGRLAAQVAEDYLARGHRAFLDCAVWNVSAHKAFEAAGFVRLRPEPFPPID